MSSPNNKKTVIIIPGAWHIPIHYSKLATRLSQAGYTVHNLHLPSTGDAPTTTDFTEDVSLIRDTIQQACDQGHDIIIVVHSAGGVPGSQAAETLSKPERQAKGKEGGVVRMVYMCAAAVPEGLGTFKATNGPADWISVSGKVCSPTDPEERFYNGCSPEDIKMAVANLKLHSVGAMWSNPTYAAWKHIPSTYLVCENDNGMPLEAQEAMIGQPEAKFEVERCEAGHSRFLSMPDFTAKVVRRAAGEEL